MKVRTSVAVAAVESTEKARTPAEIREPAMREKREVMVLPGPYWKKIGEMLEDAISVYISVA